MHVNSTGNQKETGGNEIGIQIETGTGINLVITGSIGMGMGIA